MTLPPDGVHWRGYGDTRRPALVVLHGLFGSLDNWVTLCRRWAGDFHVLAYDARNHGRSFHDDAMSYPVLAEDLRRFLDARRLGRAHLLGHSMGGKTAMEFAVRYPSRVDRLVVVDIAPRGYPPGHDAIFEALAGVHPAAAASRHELDTALARRVPSAPIRGFLLKNVRRAAGGGLEWKLNLPVLRRSYDELRGQVAAGGRCDRPAFLIAGGRSPYVTAGDRTGLREIFPRIRVCTIRNAGHWVHAEAPDDMEREVRAFLLGPARV